MYTKIYKKKKKTTLKRVLLLVAAEQVGMRDPSVFPSELDDMMLYYT